MGYGRVSTGMVFREGDGRRPGGSMILCRGETGGVIG